jgi:CRISPR system Cascade subunit CasE
MEIARIQLNPAHRQAKRDLADAYEMHSTLTRAFVEGPDAVPAKFLWRLESPDSGAPYLLVQSGSGGRWQALQDAFPGWPHRIESRQWDPIEVLKPEATLAFRLRANPTVTRDGKRRALLKEADQQAWLHRQFDKAGLRALVFEVRDAQRLSAKRRKEGGALLTVNAVLFEGQVEVIAPSLAAQAVQDGLGHARMLGLGLLSLAPRRP